MSSTWKSTGIRSWFLWLSIDILLLNSLKKCFLSNNIISMKNEAFKNSRLKTDSRRVKRHKLSPLLIYMTSAAFAYRSCCPWFFYHLFVAPFTLDMRCLRQATQLFILHLRLMAGDTVLNYHTFSICCLYTFRIHAMMTGFTAIHPLMYSMREQCRFLLSGSLHFYLGRTTAGINFGRLSNYFSLCEISSEQNGFIRL